MTVTPGQDRRVSRLPALKQALDAAGIDPGTPELMADTGLAHDHVRLGGTGWIARLPKQSQMQLAPAENLAYQAACFERASASGHAPRLYAVLPPEEVAEACRHWLGCMPGPERAAFSPWILPMRRAMWLWSMTWCAKWRVLSGREAKTSQDGEDWAAGKSEADLIAHVRGRVDHYLDPRTAERLDSEFDLLADRL